MGCESSGKGKGRGCGVGDGDVTEVTVGMVSAGIHVWVGGVRDWQVQNAEGGQLNEVSEGGGGRAESCRWPGDGTER